MTFESWWLSYVGMKTMMIYPGKTISRIAACWLVAVGIGLLLCIGCSESAANKSAGKARVLRLATTTSTRDSGLLDELLPVFETQCNSRVDVIAVGTGAALKLGERGDADVVMVHARKAELAFMDAGHGTRHEEFMCSEFVLLGPGDDPAQIRDCEPLEALQRIAKTKQRFVSRGDDSGTHKREMDLWDASGGRPVWEAYLECGQGMGPTLMMADQKQTYVLADMGTYLMFREKIELVPLVAGAECLHNPYAAIVVNSEKHSKINASLANAFVDFLVAAETQQLIAGYRVSNQQSFYPTRLSATK